MKALLFLSIFLLAGLVQAQDEYIDIVSIKSFSVGKPYQRDFGYRLEYYKPRSTYTDDLLINIDHNRTTDKICLDMLYKLLDDTKGAYKLNLYVKPGSTEWDAVTFKECRITRK